MTATNLVIRENSAPLCSCVWGNPRVCSHRDETKRTSSLMLCASLLTAKREFFCVCVCVCKLAVATLGKCLEHNCTHVCRSRMNCSKLACVRSFRNFPHPHNFTWAIGRKVGTLLISFFVFFFLIIHHQACKSYWFDESVKREKNSYPRSSPKTKVQFNKGTQLKSRSAEKWDMIDVDPFEMSVFIPFRFFCAQRQTNQPLS